MLLFLRLLLLSIKGKVQYVKERNMAMVMQMYAFAHIVQANRVRKLIKENLFFQIETFIKEKTYLCNTPPTHIH
jgi:hypothetical protein